MAICLLSPILIGTIALGSSALGEQPVKRGKPMKKNKVKLKEDDLRTEYDLSKLKGGVRGKYLSRYRAGTNLALLAPDVRAAFPTDEAVNQALRAVMQSQNPAQGGKNRTS